MAALNKFTGCGMFEMSPYKSAFGMDYDEPLPCTIGDLHTCTTNKQQLTLDPANQLERVDNNTGAL